MFSNQFGNFIDLDPDSSNLMDPDTTNPDPHHWCIRISNAHLFVCTIIFYTSSYQMLPSLFVLCQISLLLNLYIATKIIRKYAIKMIISNVHKTSPAR